MRRCNHLVLTRGSTVCTKFEIIVGQILFLGIPVFSEVVFSRKRSPVSNRWQCRLPSILQTLANP